MEDDDYQLTLMYLRELLGATADWADDQLAAGTSPKWVALKLVESARYLRTLIVQALG